MFSRLTAPRELVLLMRLIAVLGATKIATVVYYDLLFPTEPTAAEIAASEREIREIAETGEARVFADFRKRAPGVLEAARKCRDAAGASCRWAEIWIERYHLKAQDVLRAPGAHDAATVAAARDYREAYDLQISSKGGSPGESFGAPGSRLRE